MNIDDLTLGDIKKLQLMLAGSPVETKPCTRRHVIVRSRGAGVFFGTIVAERATEVDLIESRHIWSWQGALTVDDIAANGITGGKLSVPVTQTVSEKLQVIDCTEAAVAAIAKIK